MLWERGGIDALICVNRFLDHGQGDGLEKLVSSSACGLITLN